MIPDKLYAKIVAGILHASTEPHKVFGEEYPEYIRKEALLERIGNLYFSAYEKAERSKKDEDVATQNAFAVVIDEIKSM